MATLRLTEDEKERIKNVQKSMKVSLTDILKSGIDLFESIANGELSYEEYIGLVEKTQGRVKK